MTQLLHRKAQIKEAFNQFMSTRMDQVSEDAISPSPEYQALPPNAQNYSLLSTINYHQTSKFCSPNTKKSLRLFKDWQNRRCMNRGSKTACN